MDGDSIDVEVLEFRPRGYLVRPRTPEFGGARLVRLPPGTQVELSIAGTPAVRCRVLAEEDGALRLLRGWGLG